MDSYWFGICSVCDLGGTEGAALSLYCGGFRQGHNSTSQASLAPAGPEALGCFGMGAMIG